MSTIAWVVFARRVYTELEATAYHEAGHTLTAYVLRIRIVRVSIEPNLREGSLGHLQYSSKMDSLPRELVEDRLGRIIQVLMSGLVAERLFTGKENLPGAAADLALIDGIAPHLWPPDQAEAALRSLWQATEKRLADARAWSRVSRLADHLLDINPTIDGRKAMMLLKSWEDAVFHEFP